MTDGWKLAMMVMIDALMMVPYPVKIIDGE